jgi:hypothetical protein
MNKIDYKKEMKVLYTGKKGTFNIIEVPNIKYLHIHGSGNPNTDPSYASSVEALYSIAYTIKFICKKKDLDFVVMPLEGLWYAEEHKVFENREKEKWNWTMMIMMPPFVTEEIFMEAVETVKKKKDNEKISEVFFEEYEEGLTVQTLHIGSYDEEGPVIAEMHRYISDEGYDLRGKHHEIYLSDPRKNSADKLKTILRQPIVKK